MTIYRLENDKNSNRYKLIRRVLVIWIALILIFSLYLLIYFFDLDNVFMAILILVALLYIPYSIYLLNRNFRRLGESLASAEIELGDDYIIMRQDHKPDIRIHQDEISYVSSQKGLTVHTESKFQKFFIPENLAGYDEIKFKLADWTSIKPASNWESIKYVTPLLVISFGIILGAILVVVTRSIWPLVLLIVLVLSRIVYFVWFNSQRVDLTRREMRSKLIFSSIYFLIFAYMLFIAIKGAIS